MRILLPLLCLAIVLSGCSAQTSKITEEVNIGPQKIALIGPQEQAISLTVDIADDDEERRKGLKGVDYLAEDHGMLFLFPLKGELTFWMKDTLIPLDIIFFSPQGNVIQAMQMPVCEADPCPKYTSMTGASIALEVNAGFVEQNGIDTGWQIALPLEE